MSLTSDQILELSQQIPTIDKDGSGYIDLSELKKALDSVGFKIPQYEVREIILSYSESKQNTLSFAEFRKLCADIKSKDVATTFKKVVSKRENLETIGGTSEASTDGTTHSVRLEEQIAFSDWVNSNLSHDSDLKHLLPIDKAGKTLYERVSDGLLLCKIINHSCPETIDERAINKRNLTIYTKHENLTLALNSSQSIGCNIINIDASDLSKGTPHLVLGLLWQIIRIGLFSQINLEHCPGLANLLLPGETLEDFLKLTPEQILIRWVNYHMQEAGVARRISNFTSDIKDSVVYTHLLNQIASRESNVNTSPLREPDLIPRAELMLQQADKIHCRAFVSPKDVVAGNYKLNLAFVANLFNTCPGLKAPDELPQIEETREERTYRNWMNSMGVRPHVHWLYSDLAATTVVFQLYDLIHPGRVDWKQVNERFTALRRVYEQLENCNYAITLGRSLNYSLVGIAGKDIQDGNRTLTLALVWQLMRSYTVNILTELANSVKPIADQEIISWVNEKLLSADKKSHVSGFSDTSLASAVAIIDLVDSIRPNTIDYELVKLDGSKESNLANSKYAISMARKIGAKIYALPEDIAEVNHKMIMTVFACLMTLDYIPASD